MTEASAPPKGNSLIYIGTMGTYEPSKVFDLVAMDAKIKELEQRISRLETPASSECIAEYRSWIEAVEQIPRTATIHDIRTMQAKEAVVNAWLEESSSSG